MKPPPAKKIFAVTPGVQNPLLKFFFCHPVKQASTYYSRGWLVGQGQAHITREVGWSSAYYSRGWLVGQAHITREVGWLVKRILLARLVGWSSTYYSRGWLVGQAHITREVGWLVKRILLARLVGFCYFAQQQMSLVHVRSCLYGFKITRTANIIFLFCVCACVLS